MSVYVVIRTSKDIYNEHGELLESQTLDERPDILTL